MLIAIVGACLVGGLLSLLVAGLFALRVAPARLGSWVAFAAGVMLAAVFLDLLPEALTLAGPGQTSQVLAAMLAGLLGFFVLERLALWRHAHPEGSDCGSRHVAPAVVLLGDGVHNFVDGVLIAAAFLSDPWLGVTTTAAVALHEIPQEFGDFLLLRAAGWSRRKALLANGASALAAVLGGVLGWWALDGAQAALPYALAIAAASFLYVAVADLLPWLHRRHAEDGWLMQSAVLGAGLAVLPLAGHWLH